jgi:transcriptional regulator with XRE-family HTH domain
MGYIEGMAKERVLNRKIRAIGINVVARACGLNKSTVSRYVNGEREYSLKNFEIIELAVKAIEKGQLQGRTSARAATQRVHGGENWRVAYFDFVDSFLATQSEHLLSERPVEGLGIKPLSLICAIVMQLCHEAQMDAPEWAKASLELEQPWFLSNFESLRAISLVESPIFFKRNNIYAGADFLKRV